MNDICCYSTINSDLDILQRSDVGEADFKIILHIQHAAISGYKNIFVLSSDTDVVVLALYFFQKFTESNLKTLWFQVVSGKSSRNIPLHKIFSHYGESFCSILPALHQLTGSNYTSNVGTKYSALLADPLDYLQNFGQDVTELSIEQSVECAEEYLVRVLTSSLRYKTFDQLRYHEYKYSICSLVEDLPPTSNSIKLHILRALYIVYEQTHIFENNFGELNPIDFGWDEEDDMLIPKKSHLLFPPIEDLVPQCTDTTCSRSCVCVSFGVKCCSFCNCEIMICVKTYNKNIINR
uniref:NYN domain-containing protein n=1 Tax=Trichogramma kaykai TaxID=54128 RepID=A0ABD2X1Z4_9HYME